MPTLPSLKHRASRLDKRVKRVDYQAFDTLIARLKSLQVGSRVPADLLSDYASQVRKVILRLKRLEQLHHRTSARLNITQWRIDQGARLARTRDLNAQLAWLLNGQCRYATAQGKRTFAKLGVEHYQTIGKLGAQVRWQRERERKALQTLEDYHV